MSRGLLVNIQKYLRKGEHLKRYTGDRGVCEYCGKVFHMRDCELSKLLISVNEKLGGE